MPHSWQKLFAEVREDGCGPEGRWESLGPCWTLAASGTGPGCDRRTSLDVERGNSSRQEIVGALVEDHDAAAQHLGPRHQARFRTRRLARHGAAAGAALRSGALCRAQKAVTACGMIGQRAPHLAYDSIPEHCKAAMPAGPESLPPHSQWLQSHWDCRRSQSILNPA